MSKKNGNGARNGAKLEIAVDFGSVSIGDETAHVSCSVPRASLGIAVADEFFCCKRLSVCLQHSGECDPDQKTIPGLEDAYAELDGVADTGNVGFSRKKIGFGLTFAIDEVGTAELGAFAKRHGTIKIHSVEALPEKQRQAKHTDHEDVGPRPIDPSSSQQPLPLGQDSGAGMPVSEFVKFGLSPTECEMLADNLTREAGGITVGHLETYMKKSEFWDRNLKGFGQAKIGKLQDAHLKFRTHYPPPTDEDRDRQDRGRQAYAQGAEAALADPKAKNPHPKMSPEYAGWQRGFDETTAETGSTAFDQEEGEDKGKGD